MQRRTAVAAAAAGLLLALGVQAQAQAQTHTQALRSKPIRIIVPAPAGTAPDIVARLLGEKFNARFGHPAVIDNRNGAAGIVAVNAMSGAPTDGTQLILAQASVAVVTPMTYKEAKYDMERDFVAVANVADTPMLFAANPDTGPKTFAEAIAKAKAQPGEISLGNPFRGSIPHLAAELVDQRTGGRFQHVAMGTTGQGIQSVVKGDIQMYVDGISPMLPLVKAGRMRALAVTTTREMPGLEGIPLASAQIPNFKVSGWFVLFAPKGTPKDVVEELNKATNEAMSAPDVATKLRELGTYPMGGTVADAAAFVKSEKKLWSDVLQRASIKPE